MKYMRYSGNKINIPHERLEFGVTEEIEVSSVHS
jgi:hypothetical protein